MPTASTKSRARKATQKTKRDTRATATAGWPAAKHVGQRTETAAPESFDDNRVAEMSDRAWFWASLAVIAAAAFLRLYLLELKPMHHDEGVNGFFLTNLVREGRYQYDPSNYHGPVLYYFALVPVVLLGLNTYAVRLVPALFGVATVVLPLLLTRRIGRFGALSAAALIAVSPGAVFISRYFIHEALFVFFTFGAVVCLIRYYDAGRPSDLLLASAALALLFATKETAFISVGVLILAALVAILWMRFVWNDKLNLNAARYGSATDVALLFGGAIALSLFINVVFYSSFFTNQKGLAGAVESLKIWTKTGASEFHKKPFSTYISWLQAEEAPAFVLAMIGTTWALLKARQRFAVFTGAWAFGILAAYSLIPYKTPWLALNISVPMALAAGFAMEFMRAEALKRWGTQAPALIILTAAVGVSSYQTVKLNFYEYDNDSYLYVYAHTKRDTVRLVEAIENLARRAGTGTETPIAITSNTADSGYWPLPWYLRDYKSVAYLSGVGAPTQPVVICSQKQTPEMMAQPDYVQTGTYTLRPGVDLALFARRELATRRTIGESIAHR
ncbi:MAG: flippase activity-associated protein Agl23 [Pyrinomonadaceae bacterium]